MFLSVIVFIFILGLLIFVHELGHFLVAKKNDVRVEEFGLGFPPRLLKFKKGETTYSLNLIPLGGFVKIYGEDGQGRKEKDSFVSKTVWQRAKIIAAGVVMNVLLAVFLLGVGYMLGLPSLVDSSGSANKVQVLGLEENSALADSGLQTGDLLLSVQAPDGNYMEIKNAQDVGDFSRSYRGQELSLVFQRGQEIKETKIFSRPESAHDQSPLGLSLGNIGEISFPWYRAFGEAIITTFYILGFIFLSIFKVVVSLLGGSAELASQISGPVGIYSLTSQATQMGFIYLLQLTVLLSLNLAVINILPLPALDGGRLLFLLIEKIKGRALSAKIEQKIHTAGFLLLLLLLLIVTFKDVVGFFN